MTIIRRFGRVDYLESYQAMQDFTAARDVATPDEIWVLEHFPVFTQGQAGRAENLLQEMGIPLVQSDRGGQITYHGPGQVVIYLLLDLRRRQLKVRELVEKIEQAIIDFLATQSIAGERLHGAPGIYVEGKKIAALGLRVRGGCCYHGLSFNADLDLSPFSAIHPCGYRGLEVTSAKTLRIASSVAECFDGLLLELLKQFPDH